MTRQFLLAHDLGTTGDKASLYDDSLTLVGSVTIPYDTDFGVDGRAEQDANAYWTAFCAANVRLLSTVDTTALACVALSGQMMGALLLDEANRPVRPAIIWADTRSVEQCEALVGRVGMAAGYRMIGHRLNPTYTLSKLMYVRETEPEAFSRTTQVMQAKDYVGLLLTGVPGTDPSDASSMNAFDQVKRDWAPELLDAAGISGDLFPPILPSASIRGTVRNAESGLPMGLPVVVGGGDGPCAAVGAGVTGPDRPAYAYLGSSSWVSVAADEPLHDPLMRTMTFDHVVPGRFVPTATMQAGGASIEWVTDLLNPGRFDELLGAAGNTTAAEDGLLFLPYLLGERSPYWNPRARGTFIGLHRQHGPAEMARAVLEGVAMNLRVGLDAFAEMGRPAETVDAIGGGARSDAFMQVLADVWGVPVRRRSLVEEANSLGAAVIGAVAVGLLDGFDRAAEFSDVVRTFSPDDARHSRYERRYAEFLEAYRLLEPLFDRITR
jgi:xylulokinase